MKKLIVIFMFAATAISFSSCSKKSAQKNVEQQNNRINTVADAPRRQTASPPSVKSVDSALPLYALSIDAFQTEALTYLHNKYNIEFMLTGGAVYDGNGYMTSNIYPVDPAGYYSIISTVRYSKSTTDFTDDYAIAAMWPQMTKCFHDLAVPIYGENMVSLYQSSGSTPLLPESVGLNAPLGDILKNINSDLICVWYTAPPASGETKEQNAEKLRQKLQESGCRIHFSIVYLSNVAFIQPNENGAREYQQDISGAIINMRTFAMGEDYQFQNTNNDWVTP